MKVRELIEILNQADPELEVEAAEVVDLPFYGTVGEGGISRTDDDPKTEPLPNPVGRKEIVSVSSYIHLNPRHEIVTIGYRNKNELSDEFIR